MRAGGVSPMMRRRLKEVEMLPTIVAMFFVVAVLVFAVYALVRSFTHTHYRHPSEKLWRPLN